MAIWTNDSAASSSYSSDAGTDSSWVDDTFVQGGSAAFINDSVTSTAWGSETYLSNGTVIDIEIRSNGLGNQLGTYDAVNVSSSGTGLTITVDGITPGGEGFIISYKVGNGGQGYEAGDDVTIDAGGSNSEMPFRITQTREDTTWS